MQAQVETTVVNTPETASPLETSFGDEQPVVTVPYSSLRPSPLNVRTKPCPASRLSPPASAPRACCRTLSSIP